MRTDLKKKIDKEIRRDRNRTLRKWGLLALAPLLVLGIYTPVFSERLYGETIGFRIDDVGNVAKFEMRVRLERGTEVSLLVDKGLERHLGSKVEVSRMTSIAGMASYQFVQYVGGADLQ